jgi:protein-S-isoprenylcysteine O-methyltransferase Ste14
MFTTNNNEAAVESRLRGPAVKKRDLQKSMYESHDASMAQRMVSAALAALWVALVWWLLFGGGLTTVGSWFGQAWKPGDLARRAWLAAALSIYYVRLLFTMFVFLKRGVSWGEVLTVSPWILGIYLLLAICGGRNASAFGMAGGLGVALFVVGSWTNSYAEYARHGWKKQPENRGRLYTQGLFQYSRHPNYFGDLISFSGLCLMAGVWITVVIPLLMLAGFIFVNVPALDAHLHDRYGDSFDQYAKRTRKLIPFIY